MRILIVAAVALLLLAGCGSDDPEEDMAAELRMFEAVFRDAPGGEELRPLLDDALRAVGVEPSADAYREARNSLTGDGAGIVETLECIPDAVDPDDGLSFEEAASLCAGYVAGAGEDDPLEHVEALPVGASAPGRCAAALESASAAADPDGLIHASLSECQDVEEWGYALSQHPGAFGLEYGDRLTVIEIQAACVGVESKPVCADAKERELL